MLCLGAHHGGGPLGDEDYRRPSVAPDGSLFEVWEGDPEARPNGIALSPDESLLYVTYSGESLLRVFDVSADGSTANERILAETARFPDGLAVDADGNLFVATRAGIQVFAPDGAPWGAIVVPRPPSNVAFGGADARTLYITAQAGLYRVDLPVSGLY